MITVIYIFSQMVPIQKMPSGTKTDFQSWENSVFEEEK